MGDQMNGQMNPDQTCYVYPASPPTDGLVQADVTFNRSIYMNGSLNLDDGNSVRIWGYVDGTRPAMSGPFPSPAMRVTEGQIVHTHLVVGNMWAHTIHHHGIEPSTQSDGVGHYSFDVQGGAFTYQWVAKHAGTYFYHCHTNTVLHAEMGMYGGLIIDPQPDPADPPGTQRAFAGGPIYDRECIWVPDEIDSNWHGLPWDAGTCGGNVGLHDINPDYFIITGVDGAQSALTAPGIAVTMDRNERLLARYICASYLPQRINLGALEANVIASDGRPVPTPQPVTELIASSGQRYDLMFTPTVAGVYPITFEFLDWVTGQVVGTATTRITVG